MTTVTIPRVHLNGTSREELLNQLSEAHHALMEALGAMGRAAPHGRDYYVISDEAIHQAGAQHRARCAKMVEVLEELELIAQGIIAQ
jgi:hypothetical protein